MKSLRCLKGLAVMTASMLSAPLLAQTVSWQHVANNADDAPGSGPGFCLSQLQPARHQRRRARRFPCAQQRRHPADRGQSTPPTWAPARSARCWPGRIPCPIPTTRLYTEELAQFSEFPHSAHRRKLLAAGHTRTEPAGLDLYPGQHRDTVGTSGIYVSDGAPAWTGGQPAGAVVEADQVTLSFPWFAVPDAVAGTRFDQFPGSPTPYGGHFVAFKGNYTDPFDGLGKTGVYYRNVASSRRALHRAGGKRNTLIPNQPVGGDVKFGATAPPSAAAGSIYFTGWTTRTATMGGIYRASPVTTATPPPHSPPLPLTTIVGIGDQVPGQAPGETFSNFGEVLSLDANGSRVAFWASWGSATVPHSQLPDRWQAGADRLLQRAIPFRLCR